MRIGAALWLCVACCVAAPAAAQDHAVWPERMFVSVNVPVQTLDNDVTESISVADALRRNENDAFVARYESVKGALADVATGVRFAKRIGVGVAVSWLQRTSASVVDLSIPNPLVAGRPLTLSAPVPDLDRKEIGIHIQALYALPLGRRTRVTASGGPSVFVVTQDLIESVEFERLPGFTGIQFADATVRADRETGVGFNAGADVTWTLTSHFGVGTLVRYSRATVTFNPSSASSTRSIEVTAGGLHLGGGIRVLF
jgi:hypothetical protein